MQIQIGVISAATAVAAIVIFLTGVATFRSGPSASAGSRSGPSASAGRTSAAQVRAASTMWAGVLSVCALLCFAGTMLSPPF
jgi:hypothetical protein